MKPFLKGLLIMTLAFGNLLPTSIGESSIAHAEGETQLLSSNLLAQYPLIDDVKDVSGNGKDGEAVGSVSFSDGLTLPGGSGSSTNYVKLPTGLFDNQDSVTVSLWLKSNTGSGNYSALFFGTPANSSSVPVNYWLFNPTNPSGNFKSVFTNTVNNSAPWSSEVGVTSPSTTGNKGVWTHYATVITPTSLTGYINGVKIGTVSKTRKTSDFGTGLNAYIGRSNYLNDPAFAGSFQDLRIYGEALNDAGVSSVYTDGSKVMALQQAKKELALGDTSAVADHMTLPLTGANGSTISWKSSDETAISNTGVVSLKTSEQKVTLTATISLGGYQAAKEFAVTLVSSEGIAETFADKLYIPYVLIQGDTLPTSMGSASIKWSSSRPSIISNDGTIQPSSQGMEEVSLTAMVSISGQQAVRQLKVKVMETAPSYVFGYIRSGSTLATDAMHLAYSQDGGTYSALNNHTGVLFAKADFTTSIAGVSKKLIKPYIFRMVDGTFGVVATRQGSTGLQSADEKSSILFFKSKDLVSYEEAGLISLHTNLTVTNPISEVDPSTGEYRIEWKAEDGSSFYNTTKDFVTVSDPKAGAKLTVRNGTVNITDAVPSNRIPVTKVEAKAVTNKLMKVTNTSVASLSINVEKDQKFTFNDLSQLKVTASYNDGSTANKAVNWNEAEFNQIDFSKKGVYKVNGTVKQTLYPSNMIKQYADPNVFRFKGKYYFIATNENGQKDLNMRSADTILGLKDAASVTIWTANASGDMSGSIWAPELHEVNGQLYIFFAAGSPSAWNTVQSRVMKLKDGGNPLSASDWEAPIRVQNKEGGFLYTEGITLDMTTFEHKGEYYIIWAQRKIASPENSSSDLYLAKIDPSQPWKLMTDPVRIARPEYGWDRRTTPVDEGPFVLKHGDKVFVTFSGSGVDQTYSIGLLSADGNSNLLDPASWTKTNYPILTSESVPGEYGPGHNSYVEDEDGVLVNIYHTIPSSGGQRNTNARRVHWAADDTPVLDMTLDREILPENRAVTATFVVANDSVPAIPNLLMWYKFDETNGTTAVDSSGNNNDGTYVNTPSFGTGINGGSFKMAGGASNSTTAPYVRIPNGILKDAANITISSYVKWSGGANNQWLYALGINSNQYIFTTPSTGSAMNTAITNVSSSSTGQGYTAEQRFGMSSPLSTNVWKHVAAVINFDTKTANLYVDGIEVGRNENMTIKPSDLYNAANNYSGYIGKSFYPDPYFAGEVDDFRIYNKALSAEEVSTLSGNTAAIINMDAAEQKTKPLIDGMNHTITMVLKPGSNLKSLAPSLTLSNGANVIPASGSVQDFTNPVTYTVTGKDNKIQQWTVTAKILGTPVLPGLYADPNVAVFGNKFYIYPTTDGFAGWSGTQFKAFSSDDLVNWTDHGVIFDVPKDTTWAAGKAWAPGIEEKNGKYYFYFCADSKIGVAVSDSPTGPFVDALGKPLVATGQYGGGQMIDPAVFTDEDGQSYLYFGNGRAYVGKLNADMISLSDVKDITPSGYNEGSFVFKRDGKYYFMWSENDTRDENYRVAYAIGNSPTGPFTKQTVVLQKDLSLGIKGTGHHSVVKVPGKDEYYVVYHRFAIPGGDGTHRETTIDKMAFNADGTIKPIVVTLEGISPVTIPGVPTAANASLQGPASAAYGQSFDVTYGLNSVSTNVYAQDITISYDPHQLEFLSADSLKDNWKIVAVSSDTTGKVRIIAANIGSAQGTMEGMFKLSWKVMNSTANSSTLTLSDVAMASGDGIETTVQGGTYRLQLTDVVQVPGDMNGDNHFSVGDLAMVASYYGKTSSDPNWIHLYMKADFNHDDVINVVDLAAMARLILE